MNKMEIKAWVNVAGGITNIIFLPLFFGKKGNIEQGNIEKIYTQSHDC